MDLRDTKDSGLERVKIAGDGGLQRLHQMNRRHDGVMTQIGHGGVGPFTIKDDFEVVAATHDRTRGDAEAAFGQPGPVVHAKYGICREQVEQAIVNHAFGAAEPFFGRLENQIDRAGKVAVLRQVTGCGQEHGDVTVVAASVHFARVFAGVFEGVGFLHGQGIHVGAQANGAAGACGTLNGTYHAGNAQAAMHGDAP